VGTPEHFICLIFSTLSNVVSTPTKRWLATTKLINGMENLHYEELRIDSDTWDWWVWKHVELEVIWLRYSSF